MSTVTFPGLGLTLHLNRVAFSIGTFHVYWYGIIIALGFFFGVAFCCAQAKKFGLKPDDILDMIIFAAPGGIIGAPAPITSFSIRTSIATPMAVGALRLVCPPVTVVWRSMGGLLPGSSLPGWWHGIKRFPFRPWQTSVPLAF